MPCAGEPVQLLLALGRRARGAPRAAPRRAGGDGGSARRTGRARPASPLARQRGEHGRRVLSAAQRVAQRRRERVERPHVRSRNARSAGGRPASTSSRRYSRDQPVGAAEPRDGGGAPVGEEERRERQGGRPSLRAARSSSTSVALELGRRRPSAAPRPLPVVIASSRGPSSVTQPLGAHPRDRQRRLGARGDRQRRRAAADRSTIAARASTRRASPAAPARRRATSTNGASGSPRPPPRRPRAGPTRAAGAESLSRSSSATQANGRSSCSLHSHEQRRLAVARRRDQHDDRRPAGLGQRLHQSRTRHVRGRDERPGGPAPQERRDVADVPERLRRSDALHEPIVDRRRAHHRHEHPPARAPRARGCASRSHGGQPPVRRGSAPHLAVASFIPTG